MYSSGFTEFNIDYLAGFSNDSYRGDGLDFNEPNWDLPNFAGPSQPYTGVDVQGDLNNYPDFLTPSTAPISLYPANEVYPDEEYQSPFYQGTVMPSCSPQLAADPSLFPFTAPSPIPILSHGLPSLSSLSYTAPITPADHPYVQPQVIPHPEDLGFGFPTAAESFPLPAVHPSPVYNPSHEEYPVWCQYPQSDPFHLDTPPFNLITVSGHIPVVIVIHLNDFAGYHPT
ncbi:hypothetical protein BDM02DRAFT_996185 [Thelephora ganbajun]|uniref:Uncharacterized protein n=1 Tax=Thelephora ganbajun TaxID=370292 RepID=A0ACB6Z3H4_THEGA|nr:hypothetical protein BDM02DRAFT_996185 [Thelephora ganbajun]